MANIKVLHPDNRLIFSDRTTANQEHLNTYLVYLSSLCSSARIFQRFHVGLLAFSQQSGAEIDQQQSGYIHHKLHLLSDKMSLKNRTVTLHTAMQRNHSVYLIL